MREVVSRKELKYLVRLAECGRFIETVQQQLRRDDHGGINGYPVRSVYFDSIEDADYNEVLDGLEVRKKLRLRVYSPQSQTAKLERKSKIGSDQVKVSIKLDRDQAYRLLRSDFSVLLELREPEAAEIYLEMQNGVYRPKTMVEYDRLAFTHPVNKTRITIDSNIRASVTEFNIFKEHMLWTPIFTPDIAVIEVKYNGFLMEFVQNALNTVELIQRSNSKYMQARELYLI